MTDSTDLISDGELFDVYHSAELRSHYERRRAIANEVLRRERTRVAQQDAAQAAGGPGAVDLAVSTPPVTSEARIAGDTVDEGSGCTFCDVGFEADEQGMHQGLSRKVHCPLALVAKSGGTDPMEQNVTFGTLYEALFEAANATGAYHADPDQTISPSLRFLASTYPALKAPLAAIASGMRRKWKAERGEGLAPIPDQAPSIVSTLKPTRSKAPDDSSPQQAKAEGS